MPIQSQQPRTARSIKVFVYYPGKDLLYGVSVQIKLPVLQAIRILVPHTYSSAPHVFCKTGFNKISLQV